MKNCFTILLILMSFITQFSCEKGINGSEEDNMILEITENNSAILEGRTIGVNLDSICDLRKTIDVVLEDGADKLYIDKAYVCRQAKFATYVYWIIPVQNISGDSLSYIHVTGIEFRTSDNMLIYSDDSYISGEVGISGRYCSHCFLASHAEGYIFGIEEMPYDEIAKINIRTAKPGESYLGHSALEVVPVNYKITRNDLLVEIKNKSKETVNLAQYFEFILLDNDNLPLFWSFFNIAGDEPESGENTTLDAGETVYYKCDNNYAGKCNRIKPLVDYCRNVE
jgi:hypothetical protein